VGPITYGLRLSHSGHSRGRQCLGRFLVEVGQYSLYFCYFRVPLKAAPLEDPNFIWPTLTEIKQLQNVAVQERSQLLLTQRGDDVWITESGVVWVPQDVAQMEVRLCVVAHFGMAGHRGVETTLQRLKLRFWWHG
jgi:hypothetical protein